MDSILGISGNGNVIETTGSVSTAAEAVAAAGDLSEGTNTSLKSDWQIALTTLENAVLDEMDRMSNIMEGMKAAEKARVSDAIAREKELYVQECQQENAALKEKYENEILRITETDKKEIAEIKEQKEKEIATLKETYEKEIAGLKVILDNHAAEFEKGKTVEISELNKKWEEDLAEAKNANDAELQKMKILYAEQIGEIESAFREKNNGLRKEIDKYKEQIEILMLQHHDDSFFGNPIISDTTSVSNEDEQEEVITFVADEK